MNRNAQIFKQRRMDYLKHLDAVAQSPEVDWDAKIGSIKNRIDAYQRYLSEKPNAIPAKIARWTERLTKAEEDLTKAETRRYEDERSRRTLEEYTK